MMMAEKGWQVGSLVVRRLLPLLPRTGHLTHMLSPLLGNRGLKSDVGGSTFRFDLVLYLMKVRVIPEMMGDDPAMT